MGGFASTPVFELFRRALTTQAIQKFRGINAYSTLAQLGPEWAQDLLNVIVSGSGGISKLRLPVNVSVAIPGIATGPNSFWDFQQGNGTRQVLGQFGSSMYYFVNDLANALFIETSPLNGGQWSFAAANQILFGANGQRVQKWTGTNWQTWGIVGPSTAPAAPGAPAGNLSPASGYTYTYAYKNSLTGHVSNVSPVSPSTGIVGNRQFQVTAFAPTDPQVDTIVWFRTLDGGGDQYRLAEVLMNVNNNAIIKPNTGTLVTLQPGIFQNLGINDNTPDSALDQTILGPLINGQPPVGKYVATGQNRMFIFNLNGAPQDFIYSGYEQIFLGRPEESFPPNNRIRLSIGAEQIAGGGILQAGVVAFSQTGRMYMLRGALEDITIAVPINFSAYLEELPWTLGCASHFTIQTTPYGMVWLAGDKTVQLFDGRSEPIDISTAVYPLLRRITPGTEGNCTSAYFNWLERDLYVLTCAVDGSQTANRLFIWAFNKAPGSDSIESVEVFISDIPTQLAGGMNWVGLITTSKLQRMLCISASGFIQQLPVSSDTVGGITQDFSITPATSGNLNAYWRSGYFGNESPYRSKLFRWLRLLSDQDATPYQATLRYVDDEAKTFRTPEIKGPYKFSSSKMSMNQRSKKASVEINFPAQDSSNNVLELQVAHIPTSDR